MNEILPMEADHTKQVTQLHLENLQTQFRGSAGHALLNIYYETVSTGTGGCGYVAVNDGKVLGYVCGVWDAQELRKSLLLKHGFLLVFWGMIQVLSKPKIIFDFLSRFYSGGMKHNIQDQAGNKSYELRPIVVALTYRRSGLGDQLVKKLIDDARSRGYEFIHLFTEQDNLSAQRLYERAGFKNKGKSLLSAQQYLRYELNISGGGSDA